MNKDIEQTMGNSLVCSQWCVALFPNGPKDLHSPRWTEIWALCPVSWQFCSTYPYTHWQSEGFACRSQNHIWFNILPPGQNSESTSWQFLNKTTKYKFISCRCSSIHNGLNLDLIKLENCAIFPSQFSFLCSNHVLPIVKLGACTQLPQVCDPHVPRFLTVNGAILSHHRFPSVNSKFKCRVIFFQMYMPNFESSRQISIAEKGDKVARDFQFCRNSDLQSECKENGTHLYSHHGSKMAAEIFVSASRIRKWVKRKLFCKRKRMIFLIASYVSITPPPPKIPKRRIIFHWVPDVGWKER